MKCIKKNAITLVFIAYWLNRYSHLHYNSTTKLQPTALKARLYMLPAAFLLLLLKRQTGKLLRVYDIR